MILTGQKLDEVCRAIWGADWKSVVADRLDTSRQRLHRLSQRPTGHSKELKRELLAIAQAQLVMVAKYVEELKEDVGA